MAAYEAVDSTPEEPFIPEDSFALRLIALRRGLKLTQGEAAARCGLDDGSWSNWENGTRPQGMDAVVRKIVDGLGADRDWLTWGGPLRGQNLKFLTALTAPTGQGSFFDHDLEPSDFFTRPSLTSV